MEEKQDILSFYKKYDCFRTIDQVDKFDPLKKNKTCKYCGLSEPKVSFKNKPHIIPDLLGKNSYTSNLECDVCNDIFSDYENDLAIFISPFPTLINLKGKKKVPTFASRKEGSQKATKIFVREGNRNIHLETLSDLSVDKDKKTGVLKIRRQSASKINIYKAISRIGIILMDDADIPNYREFIDWLLDKDDCTYNKIPLLVVRTMVQSKYFDKPYAMMYKLKDEKVDSCVRPQYIMILRATNMIFQIPFPMFCGIDSSKHLELELNPEIALYNKSAFFKVFNLTDNSKGLDEEINFTFSDIE